MKNFQIATSFGCINKCNFCGNNLGVMSFRNLEKISKEIEHIKKKYNPMEFYIVDANFTFSKKRVIDICNIFMKHNIRFICLSCIKGLQKAC